MDCREAREHLSDFRDGSLPRTLSEDITRHLGKCADCAMIARSLDAVREGLRDLPPLPAPPELLAEIREAIAREAGPAAETPSSAPSAISRLKTPLQTAAALLLFASTYWYWTGSGAAPRSGVPAPTPVEVAAPAPEPVEIAVPAPASAVPPAPVRVARASHPRPAPMSLTRVAEASSPAQPVKGANPEAERSIATLPEDTPDPKVRVYSLADLPVAPILRASTTFRRIQPVYHAEAPAASAERGDEADPQPGSQAPDVRTSRLRPPIPYGREVSLEVAQEDHEDAAERIALAARRLGGIVEGSDPVVSEDAVTVRVLLPERTSQAFLDELSRNGKIPPDGMPVRSVLPAGPTPGMVAYTVHLHAR